MRHGSHYLVLGCCNSIVCARGAVEYFWGIWKFKKLIPLLHFLEFFIIFAWRRCAHNEEGDPLHCIITAPNIYHCQWSKILHYSICIVIVLFYVLFGWFCCLLSPRRVDCCCCCCFFAVGCWLLVGGPASQQVVVRGPASSGGAGSRPCLTTGGGARLCLEWWRRFEALPHNRRWCEALPHSLVSKLGSGISIWKGPGMVPFKFYSWCIVCPPNKCDQEKTLGACQFVS